MIFLRLYFEFAKVGLFAVGGGLATIPFLQDMGARTGWFTAVDLTTMIAVSESTPPMWASRRAVWRAAPWAVFWALRWPPWG